MNKLKEWGWFEDTNEPRLKNGYYIMCLGDFVDYGFLGIEITLILIKLFNYNIYRDSAGYIIDSRVKIISGNHENDAYTYSQLNSEVIEQFVEIHPEKGIPEYTIVLKHIQQAFYSLPTAIIANREIVSDDETKKFERIQFNHGAIAKDEISDIKDADNASCKYITISKARRRSLRP